MLMKVLHCCKWRQHLLQTRKMRSFPFAFFSFPLLCTLGPPFSKVSSFPEEVQCGQCTYHRERRYATPQPHVLISIKKKNNFIYLFLLLYMYKTYYFHVSWNESYHKYVGYLCTAKYCMIHLKNGHAYPPISAVFCWLGGIAHKPSFKDSVARKFWSSPHDISAWIQAVWKSISLCSPYWQNTILHCGVFSSFFFLSLNGSLIILLHWYFISSLFECTQHSLVQQILQKRQGKGHWP